MTDFYALLKQSIIDRGIRDVSERQEVYAQARRAVIKQLWDYRPPLAADEIDMRVGSYDTAVERIEAELQAAFAKGETLKPKARLPAKRPAPQPEPAGARNSPPAFSDWPEQELSRGAPTERATPVRGRSTSAATRVREAEARDSETYDEPPYDEEGLEEETYRPHLEGARWWKRGVFERERGHAESWIASWTDWLGTPDEAKLRLAAIGIGGLVIILVGVMAYALGTRSHQGVTLPIGVRREVSDAATAARIPTDNLKVTQTFTIFDGVDPTVFATTPDNPIAFDSTGGFARVSSSTSAPGVKVTIGPGLASRLAGQNVRVVIVARSSQESGAAGMRFAYQSGLAISHWQTVNLGTNYAPVGMEWRVPMMQTSATGDSLLIEPGVPGDGTGVDVKSIRIDVIAS